MSFKKMWWLLKSQFDQNLIVINHKFNGNFNYYPIFGGTQELYKNDFQHYLVKLPLNGIKLRGKNAKSIGPCDF